MKIITDEFSARNDLSPQQKYQLRHERDGLCRLCPREPEGESPYCKKHLKAQRAYSCAQPKRVRTRTPAVSAVSPQDLI